MASIPRRALLTAGVALLAGLTATAAPSSGDPTPAKPPVPVILDTDIGPDVDDAGTVALLHGLAQRGEARILAMFCCTSSPWGAPCLDALNTYYGRPEIPIGTLKKPGFLVKPEYAKYNEQVARQFPNDVRSGANAPDATELYRKILSAQPRKSVVICAVGPLTNLQRLLESKPDRYSKLNGRALVAEKVASLSVMGGRYPEGKEWNFEQDPAAAAKVVADWPTRILFSGFEIGSVVFTGKRLQKEAREENPTRAAYALYTGPDKHRESWDQTAVLAAVRGPSPLWSLRTHGSNSVDPKTGANRWKVSPDREHEYLVEAVHPEAVARIIEGLMLQKP